MSMMLVALRLTYFWVISDMLVAVICVVLVAFADMYQSRRSGNPKVCQ